MQTAKASRKQSSLSGKESAQGLPQAELLVRQRERPGLHSPAVAWPPRLSGCLMSSASIQKLFCGIYLAFKYSFSTYGEVGAGELDEEGRGPTGFHDLHPLCLARLVPGLQCCSQALLLLLPQVGQGVESHWPSPSFMGLLSSSAIPDSTLVCSRGSPSGASPLSPPLESLPQRRPHPDL